MPIQHFINSIKKTNGMRKSPPAYCPTEDVLKVIDKVERDTTDPSIRQSIHFTPGVVSRIQRQITLGSTIIADSRLVYNGIHRESCTSLPVRIECFMDDPLVVSFANQKHTTRAEIAVERALALPGPKVIVVGSAPMALNRLLQLHQHSPLREVCVVAAANGFANVVELKERLWESGIPCIVVRGRKGGASSAIAIINALISGALGK